MNRWIKYCLVLTLGLMSAGASNDAFAGSLGILDHFKSRFLEIMGGEPLAERPQSQGITTDLHEKYMGRIVFQSQSKSISATDLTEDILIDEAAIGDPLFFRVFMQESMINIIYQSGPEGQYFAAEQSAGLRLRLHQYLRHNLSASLPRSDDDQPVFPSPSPLIGVLSLLQIPLPPEALDILFATSQHPELQSLRAAGLLRESLDGICLHKSARLPITALEGTIFDPIDLITYLLNSNRPHLQLEGVRLQAHVNPGALLDWLERNGESLIEKGFAPRLWRLIANLPEPDWNRWRLAVAAAGAMPDALETLQAPQNPTLADRLNLARVQALRFAVDDETCAKLQDDIAETGNLEMLWQIQFIRLRNYMNQGQLQQALDLISHMQPRHGGDALQLALTQAFCELRMGRDAPQAALLVSRELGGLGLTALERRRTAYMQAIVASLCGRVNQAFTLCARLLEPNELSVPQHHILLMACQVGLQVGALVTVKGHLARLARHLCAGDPGHRLYLGCRTAYLAAYSDLAEAEAALAQEKVHEHADSPAFRYWTQQSEAIIGRLQCKDPPELPPFEGDYWTSDLTFRLWYLEVLYWRCRAGYPLYHKDLMDSPIQKASTRERILFSLAQATHALCQGDALLSRSRLATALEQATHAGLQLLEMDIRLLELDTLYLGGYSSQLPAKIEALKRLSEAIDCRRGQIDATFYASLNESAPFWTGVLSLSEQTNSGSAQTRRARALLGLEAPLDAIDHRWILALRVQKSEYSRQVGGPLDGPSAHWGVYEPSHSLLFQDGAQLCLEHRPTLWTLITTLAEAAGEPLQKEDLVVRVWAQKTYDPSRHDATLFSTIRKLRKLIAETTGGQDPILSSEGGYALKTPFFHVKQRG